MHGSSSETHGPACTLSDTARFFDAKHERPSAEGVSGEIASYAAASRASPSNDPPKATRPSRPQDAEERGTASAPARAAYRG